MQAFFDYILKYIQLIRITDIIDIFVVAIIIYYILAIVKETRAKQLIKGIALVFAVFFISQWMHLNALNYILSATLQVGAFALVIIFQPELRNLLERMGRIKVGRLIDFGSDTLNDELERSIESIAVAAEDMSATKTGALMVIEGETKLGEYISTGTVLDASVSSALLENIFVPNTPLHDGAVIIRGNKIITAGCLLPLTSNTNLSRDLGTRHRAAIGLSEVTDAVIVVVSEETGKISVAREGSLTRNLSGEALTRLLARILLKPQNDDAIGKIKFWRTRS
ncbi:MAG: diadenylate cyclase CdaA [Clostridia bacterium]|nr:diadenylate cyclase CdaA [Clostridia bacterium]